MKENKRRKTMKENKRMKTIKGKNEEIQRGKLRNSLTSATIENSVFAELKQRRFDIIVNWKSTSIHNANYYYYYYY